MKNVGFIFALTVGLLTLGLLNASFAEGPAVPAGSVPVNTAPATAATVADAGQAAAPSSGMMLGGAMPMLIMFAALYFLMIRPQNKRMKEQKAMIAALKHGDEVVTSSGMLGTVSGIADKVVTVEVAQNVKIKFLKSQIAQVVKDQIKELT